jgi:hypothetical protein
MVIICRARKVQGAKDAIQTIEGQQRRIRPITMHMEAGVTRRRKTRGQETMKAKLIRGQVALTRPTTVNRLVIIRKIKNAVIVGIRGIKRGRVDTTRMLKVRRGCRVQSKFM